MNSVDLAAKVVQIIGAFCAFIVFIFAVGRGWATVTATLATLKRLHERLEDFEKQRIDIARIQVALGLKRPTLRVQAPPPPTGAEVPLFTDGEEG